MVHPINDICWSGIPLLHFTTVKNDYKKLSFHLFSPPGNGASVNCSFSYCDEYHIYLVGQLAKSTIPYMDIMWCLTNVTMFGLLGV